MSIVILIFIAMVFYGFGEYSSKMYANTTDNRYGIMAMLGYIVTAFCFLPTIIRYNSLTILGTIWNILYVLITLFIGLVVFKEPVTTTQAIGIVLGIVSIVLLTI